ncbi:MAG: hypothetical protein ACOZCO_17590 [Bacteroidota bacterium]
MKAKADKLIYGIVSGTLLPLIGYVIGYKAFFYRYGWDGYWKKFSGGGDIQTHIFTLSMLPTLFLFYLVFFQWKMDQFSKGLVMISLMYVAIFVYLKFM